FAAGRLWQRRYSGAKGVTEYDAHVTAWSLDCRLSLARFERWRRALLRPLREGLSSKPVKPPKGATASRKFLTREEERLAALGEVREYCRGRVVHGSTIRPELSDIAANIGLRLLASADPEAELRSILGTDRKSGRRPEARSLRIAMLVLRQYRRRLATDTKVSASKARAEVFSKVGARVGLTEEGVRDIFLRHKRVASAALANRELSEDWPGK
ncbi:MAG: hypothetical protein P4M15_10855, partial [Alphaproteobacteria bacterium]|nr:hypothetical protein [Alphaproteobacteria bacterium]